MEDQLNLFPSLGESFKVTRVIKRDGSTAGFDREKITNAIFKAAVGVGGRNLELARRLTQKVIRSMNEVFPAGSVPTVEEIQDIVEKVLIESGHARTAKAYILYRAERARVREKKDSILAVEDNIPYKLLWKTYAWNVDHGCDSVEKLNRQMRDGRWRSLVEDSERRYHDEIRKVAQTIHRRRKDLRLMIIAGPSSSGKTTTTIKIGESLLKSGLRFVAMNLDHYFKDLSEHPRDEFGDHDFETPRALELGMINDHVSALIGGKTIRMPHYDFKTGLRRDGVEEFKLEKDQILLIDSLHGLTPEMTESVPLDRKFKFYIEALCQVKDARGEFVRWTDLRILRRMVRDGWHRGTDPLKTVGHWHYVRRGEKKYIVPFIRAADAVFNGSLPYELPVHKVYLEKQVPLILKAYRGEPKKLDAYIRAQRIKKLLDSLVKFPDTDAIPANSFLREFIGGSVYKY